MEKTNELKFAVSSFLAGACIALVSNLNMMLGGLAGAILFSGGLIFVCSRNLHLFTGKAQKPSFQLIPMLLFNVSGVLVICIMMGVDMVGSDIIDFRLTCFNEQPIQFFMKCVACGAIMTMSVQEWAKKNYWPLLFGIPIFVLLGLPHCIADVAYLISWHYWNPDGVYVWCWLTTVVGNFVGCNLYRILLKHETRVS